MHTAKPGDRRSLQPVRSFRAQDNLQTPAREGVGDNMKTVLLRSAFLSLAVLGTGISLQSQNNSEFAHLSGTLTDANGGGIADVQVQARRDGSPSSQTWSAKSSAAGEYSLDLPAGRYRVRFTRSSFASREMVVDLAPGEPHVLSLRLGLAPLSANVVVTANTQPTELAHSPAPVDIIGAQEIEQRQAVFLPDLLSTQTGISLARTGPIGGLSTIFIDGGHSAFTKVLIDGTPVNLPGGDVNFSSCASPFAATPASRALPARPCSARPSPIRRPTTIYASSPAI